MNRHPLPRHPDCIILSDLDNMEAAATAYVLLALVVPKLVGGQKNNMPAVLQKDRPVPDSVCSALVICSDGCFKQFQFGAACSRKKVLMVHG